MAEQKRSADRSRRRRRRRKKRGGKTNVFSAVLLVIAACIFVFSCIQIVRMLLPYYQGGKEYDKVRSLAVIREGKQEQNTENTEKEEESGFRIDFTMLLNENPDTVAWIRFDEPAVISYPVVKSRDNEEYLTKTFSEHDNKLGAIFLNMYNRTEFSDRNTVIYGHNLKVGGEMFSQLNKYADAEFCRQYPWFYIYTPDGYCNKYQVFAAAVVKANAFNYQVDFHSDEEFLQYLEMCKKGAAYETDVETDADTKVVSLSTCTNVNEDERFLLQGVLVEKKKQ